MIKPLIIIGFLGLSVGAQSTVTAQVVQERGRSVYAKFGQAFTVYRGVSYCEFFIDFDDGLVLRFNAHGDRSDLYFNVSSARWKYLSPSVGRSAQVNFSFQRGAREYGYSGMGLVYERSGHFGFGGSNLDRAVLDNLVYEPQLWLKPSIDGIALPPIAISPKGVAEAVNSYQDCIREVTEEVVSLDKGLDQIIDEVGRKRNN